MDFKPLGIILGVVGFLSEMKPMLDAAFVVLGIVSLLLTIRKQLFSPPWKNGKRDE